MYFTPETTAAVGVTETVGDYHAITHPSQAADTGPCPLLGCQDFVETAQPRRRKALLEGPTPRAKSVRVLERGERGGRQGTKPTNDPFIPPPSQTTQATAEALGGLFLAPTFAPPWPVPPPPRRHRAGKETSQKLHFPPATACLSAVF